MLTPALPGLGHGTPIGQQSDSAHTLITPAGWAFSIWGMLYAGSLAYAVFQLLPPQRANPLHARIGWGAAGAFLGDAAWALYVQLDDLTFVSALIILFTLFCLLTVLRALARYRNGFTLAEQLCAVVPLTMLAAWLTAASIVNIAAALQFHGFDAPVDPALLGGGVVFVGGIIVAVALARTGGTPWYALVFLWALAAIYSASGAAHPPIGIATAASALLVIVSAGVQLGRAPNRRHWLSVRR